MDEINIKNHENNDASLRDIETQIEKNNTNLMNKSKISKKNKTVSIKKQREESYRRTLKRVQSELKSHSRVFSKIIHNKFIEKISDIISQTIARPNAMLLGSIFAFVLTLITYIVAKKIGYKLSGIETTLSFVIGWIIGIVFDYIKALISTKK